MYNLVKACEIIKFYKKSVKTIYILQKKCKIKIEVDNMKQITEIITISELSRLINVSRPTLYKYIDDYENGFFDKIDETYKKLFDYISYNVTNKKQIYDYCINSFENDDKKAILDKIKFLLDKDTYKSFFEKIIKLNEEEIKELIERIGL